MALFKKKNKDEQIQRGVIYSLDQRHVEYVVEKNKNTYKEKIIGKNGCINLTEGDLVIICQNKEVYRNPIVSLKAFELLNLNGVCIETVEESENMIIAYYKYYRK